MDEIAHANHGCVRPRAADLESLLCEWQDTGSHVVLEDLIHAAEPIMSVVIGRVLGQRGIRDPAALDDAMALVFNHLRRLPGPADGEPAVAPFDPGRGTNADHGRAFLQRLAHDRPRPRSPATRVARAGPKADKRPEGESSITSMMTTPRTPRQ